MKLSEILTEARNGAYISKISVKDASKIIANTNGELSFNTTLFQKKCAYRYEGDEIVPSLNGKKETNITELSNVFKNHSGHDMVVIIGNISYIGKVEIDI